MGANMKLVGWALSTLIILITAAVGNGQQHFTIEQILSTPFADNLVASPVANQVAWTLNIRGKRNIWVAEAPGFEARQITHYDQDDGQDLSDLQFSADGATVVFVRGEGKNSAGDYANPASNPAGSEQTIWAIQATGGEPRKIDVGTAPRVSTQQRIAYARDGQIWIMPLNAKDSVKPQHVVVRGKNDPLAWSPDGSKLLFVSDRGDHSFVGVYDPGSDSVRFLAPSVDSDSDATWSPDGKHVAFIRQPAVRRDAPSGYFLEPDIPHPWAIWVADPFTGAGAQIWQSGKTMADSYPYIAAGEGGGAILRWAANDRLVMVSEADGWEHLYALSSNGGSPTLVTPGNCEAEQWGLSPDKKRVIFNSNCGDSERRHLYQVNSAGGTPEALTKSDGIEWAPAYLSDGTGFAYITSDARHSSQAFVRPAITDPKAVALASNAIPAAFPASQLVVPQTVTFNSADGLELHAQLFLPQSVKTGDQRPALIFLHGGPMRQMLPGWHYMGYYSNAYAMNQFLASRGYVVLALNYRSGIGYGRAFREAPGRAGRGASEYQDVVAAGKYLQSRSDVDAKRVGLWGGSYGGFLTALGLGRNSDLFAAGSDFHGVHDWPSDNWEGKNIPPDLVKLAHDSSPVAAVDTWKSPVLFIHGDDDRNVKFSQTVDLVARLRARNVPLEQLVFPDELHDLELYSDWLKAYQATSDFFDKQFHPTTP